MSAVRLTPQGDSITETTTYASAESKVLGDFAASLLLENADRGDANETYDVKIQESPDPMSIADASALWYDLVTFTQVVSSGTSSEKLLVTDPHFNRMRVVATLAGTTPSVDVTVMIEGVQIG